MEPLWSVIVGIEGIFKGSWGGSRSTPKSRTPDSKLQNAQR